MNDITTDLPVAYLGPEGTYSHHALRRYFGPEQSCLPLASIEDVFNKVAVGDCDYGVVPVENSSEGSVTATLDCFKKHSAIICGEISLRINHVLMGASNLSLKAVTKVVSHQQSLGQCRLWLDQHLPDIPRVPVSSNAEAALIASRESGVAAIAGKAAAEIYKLSILAEDIEDAADNTTRFLIISKKHQAQASPNSKDDKTSLIVTTKNEPGALLEVLEPLKRYAVNMSKLESRPSGKEVWSYSFYIDVDGNQQDDNVASALAALNKPNIDVKILGSYAGSGFVHSEQARALSEPVLQDKKIVIIGLGLIGGSIARALSDRGLSAQLWAVGRDVESLEYAHNQGVIAGYSTELEESCKDADLIVIAVPGLSVAPIMQGLAGLVKDDCVITDVASVKQSTVDAAVAAFGKIPPNLVPGHPIAGSEKSGFRAARPDLFVSRRVILTPLEQTSKTALDLVSSLWRELEAEVLEMSVQQHDEVLAATSHLPHLLAFALVDSLSQQGSSDEIFRFAAGGFRDFTRIAASDPDMWRDIFLSNADALCAILKEFETDLTELKSAIKAADAEQIKKVLQRVKQSREKFLFK
jgi:prephenate dehydratase/prephenate dehydrogenase